MKNRRQILLLVALIAAAASCGRKSPAPSASDSSSMTVVTNESAQSASDSSSMTVVTNESAQPLEGPVNDFMTAQLRIFIQDKGQLPKDFGEFARARLDSVPRTPPGMKWAIDPVTQEVKLVKQ